MKIELTPSEIMSAAMAGVMRQAKNISKNRTPAYGSGNSNDWQIHIEGCLGEAALAKALDRFWLGTGVLRGKDVGDVDVRTRSKSNYELILHENDPDERIFYLLTGLNGTYTIVGWIKAGDGKKKEFWKDPAGGRPAFFVPHSALNKGLHNE